jgi:hypothetical protein
MRSIKTMLLLAIAATALAVPAAASATQWTESGSPLTEPLRWTDGGAALAGEQSIALEGPIKFSNATTGGVECTLTASGILAAGTEGVLDTISISPGSCKLNGAQKTTCASVTSVAVAAFWPLEAVEKTPGVRTMTVKMSAITYKFQPLEGEAGNFCVKQLELTGATITATPDNAKSISSVTFSGAMPAVKYNSFNTTGTPAVKPAAKFGIARAEHVVALAGNINFNNISMGGVECAVNGSLTLRPGEKGEVTSMSSKAGGCVVSGPRLTECGSPATAVFKELPWSVSTTATKTINIAKFPFEIQFGKGCMPWNLSGEMIATPNNTSAIASTALSGTLTSAYLGPQKWTGSLSWTPSGLYGIS